MLKEYSNIVDALAEEIAAYESKPTKVSSARIRKLSLLIGKQGAPIRQYMLKQDRAK